MTELELLIDFHKDAKRQGPGSPSVTLKALNFMDINKKKSLKVQILVVAQVLRQLPFGYFILPEDSWIEIIINLWRNVLMIFLENMIILKLQKI